MPPTIEATTYHVGDDLPVTLNTAGSGQPALVLHGGAGPGSLVHLVDHLSGSRRVLAPVHPGWDDTPRPDRPVGVADLADAYLDLLDQLDLRGVAVIGSSFGGWVAAEMGIRDDDYRIGALVLMGSIGPPPLAATAPRPTPPSAGRDEGPSQRNLALLQSYTGPGMHDPTLLSRLAAIAVPTLVLWGADDPVVPPAYGQVYADAIPGARFAVIPAAGHLPTSDAPEPAFAALEGFLDPARPGPTPLPGATP